MVWARNKRVVPPGHEAEEGADCCQSGIAGFWSCSLVCFPHDRGNRAQGFVDIFNAEVLDILVERVGRIAQQELNSVTVSHDRIDGKAFLGWQVVAKETFDEVGKGGYHGVPPWGLT